MDWLNHFIVLLERTKGLFSTGGQEKREETILQRKVFGKTMKTEGYMRVPDC